MQQARVQHLPSGEDDDGVQPTASEGQRRRARDKEHKPPAAMDRDDGGGTKAVMVGEGSLLPFENDGGQLTTERTGTMASQPTTPKPFRDGGEEGTKRRLTRRVKDRDEVARKANLWRRRKCGGEGGFGCCLGFVSERALCFCSSLLPSAKSSTSLGFACLDKRRGRNGQFFRRLGGPLVKTGWVTVRSYRSKPGRFANLLAVFGWAIFKGYQIEPDRFNFFPRGRLHRCTNLNTVKQIQAHVLKHNLLEDPYVVAPKLTAAFSFSHHLPSAVNVFNLVSNPAPTPTSITLSTKPRPKTTLSLPSHLRLCFRCKGTVFFPIASPTCGSAGIDVAMRLACRIGPWSDGKREITLGLVARGGVTPSSRYGMTEARSLDLPSRWIHASAWEWRGHECVIHAKSTL
ncbi:hypothetical protein PIB30_017636 [Stylosanthes scabra]|uniref:Uncharacterized protein n=1 Tax=Stylosanthes scabra TaxID=79078 RepID=A0ABU6W5R6_9FABA|nr:hypothetical protein [Stylosanthes scabra]